MKVVGDLVTPFTGVNYVVYCDSLYSSGPLVEMLASEQILFAGTMPRVFLLVSKMLNHLEAHTCLKR